MAAYDNQTSSDGYTNLFNDNEAVNTKSEWRYKYGSTPSSFLTNSSAYSTPKLVTANSMASYIAFLRRICNVTFNGYTSINIDGTLYSSPTTKQIVELNPITATAQSYSVPGVSFNFVGWKKDGVTYSSTITTDAHSTYYAVYRAKPSNSGENPHIASSIGQPITIAWTDNPNPNVNQYQIWRTVKHNGVVGPEELLATVGRGVQTYTDQEYQRTSTYVDLLHYDVRSYYNSTDPYIIGDYADEFWFAAYGQMLARPNQDPLVQETMNELPTEYSISNYPNPFNPTTTIKYQLPEAGTVTIKVYDILGKEVAELVNETKAAGYYEVNFDASKLTSGVYIYTIRTNKYFESKKMVLTK